MANEPLYMRIKDDLKTDIKKGKYKKGDKIPTEPELSSAYDVSRITVRRAIEELSSEGYLVKKQGRGTFVSSPLLHRRIVGNHILESFSQTCMHNGVVAGARLIKREIVPARADEREFLQLPEDSLLIHIQRVRTADDMPIFMENLFLPYEKYQELMHKNLNDGSSFEAIKEISGHMPANAVYRSIELARATTEQAQDLKIPKGDPLFLMNVHFVDEANNPICIGRQYYIASRYMFEL